MDLSRCTALKEVDCRKNQLTGFTWGTVSLRVLNCAENQLNSLNINNQQALEELDCSGNQLGWLMLTNLHQLDMLYAGSNPLLALNLSEQAPMTVCDLQNCVVLKKPSCNGKDLYLEPTQWSGFRLDLVQTWNNAKCSGTKVYITDPLQNITYTYNTGNPNVTASFTVQLQDIPMNIVDVTLENEKNIFYTGEPLTPDVIVVAGGNELKQGTDYTLSYENNLNAGRGTILVSGAEGSLWSGSVSLEFVIEKAVPKVTVIWDDSAEYTEGDDVPPIRLDTANTEGILMWTADTPSTFKAGRNQLQWKFVPADSSNYETAIGTIVVSAKEKPGHNNGNHNDDDYDNDHHNGNHYH